MLSRAPVLSIWSASSPGPILDPLERTSEILFGVIMVLSFTSSISVVESGHAETREVLVAALGCNLAWGIVDAAFYLMATYVDRARKLMMLRTVRESSRSGPRPWRHPGRAPLPRLGGVDDLGGRILTSAPRSDSGAAIRAARAQGSCRRVRRISPGLSLDSPHCDPFIVISNPAVAMRASNAIAIPILFGMGWTLGTHAGRPGWRPGW